MKFFLFLLIATFAVAIECKTVPQNVQLPIKCEDVLQQNLCDDLRNLTAAFKLKLSRVDDAVIDAALKGLVNSPVVFAHAVLFIKNDVMTKTCEDLLAPRMCVKLRKVAAFLKIKTDIVDAFVRDAIAKGYYKGEQIYAIVLDFYKAEVKGRTCEDFLNSDVCVKLRVVAADLKVKAEKVEEAVISAVVQGYQNRDEIYQDALDFFRDEVLSKTCEDFLANDLCASLRSVAATLKIKAEKVDKAVKEAIITGITTAKDVSDFVREFYKNEIKSKKCEDFFPTSVCDAIRVTAASFQVQADKVDDFVKDALAKGLTQVTDVVNDVVAHLKDAITCEDWLYSWTCSLARTIARKVGVKVQEVDQAVREAVAQRIKDATAIFQYIKDYINKKTLV